MTALAVAHRAAENFAGGLLVLSVAAVVMASRGPGDSALLDTLRNDSELRQLLRGPAGPQGPPGPGVQVLPLWIVGSRPASLPTDGSVAAKIEAPAVATPLCKRR